MISRSKEYIPTWFNRIIVMREAIFMLALRRYNPIIFFFFQSKMWVIIYVFAYSKYKHRYFSMSSYAIFEKEFHLFRHGMVSSIEHMEIIWQLYNTCFLKSPHNNMVVSCISLRLHILSSWTSVPWKPCPW